MNRLTASSKISGIEAKYLIERILANRSPIKYKELLAYFAMLSIKLFQNRIAYVGDADVRLYGDEPYSHTMPTHLKEMEAAGFVKVTYSEAEYSRTDKPFKTEMPEEYRRVVKAADRIIGEELSKIGNPVETYVNLLNTKTSQNATNR